MGIILAGELVRHLSSDLNHTPVSFFSVINFILYCLSMMQKKRLALKI